MSELLEVLRAFWPEFLTGLLVTLRIVAASLVIALGVGLLVGTLRVAPVRPLRWLGGLYVEFFRNIPLLVLVLMSFAGLRRAGVPIGAWTAGTASLGLYTAAYVAEAVRSGVASVGRGQIEAALSLGYTYPRALRRVVVPQAVRSVIPPIGSLVIAMIKNSAILGASLLALPDLLKAARVINSETGRATEAFVWSAVGYLVLTIPATFVVRRLERRLAVRR